MYTYLSSICLAVSKPWKHFLEASHDLWKVLDLRQARRSLRLGPLKAHLRRSNYKLDRAFLNKKGFNTPNLETITRTCRELRHLELSSIGVVGDSLLTALPRAQHLRTILIKRCQLTLKLVHEVLLTCPCLEVAEFDFVQHGAPPRQYMEWPQLDCLRSFKLVFTHEARMLVTSMVRSLAKT